MSILNIRITSDFICPWCWIGEANLERALQSSGASQVRRVFEPYLLNPQMPTEGMDRKAYRSAKFGSWERSQAMDAQVAQAGLAAGVVFNYDQVQRTPNTLAAHRLVRYVQAAGRDATALVRAIFNAYFKEGKDIGDLQVLTDLAGTYGEDAVAVSSVLQSTQYADEVLQSAELASQNGVRAVPEFNLEGHIVSGAQAPQVFSAVIEPLTAD